MNWYKQAQYERWQPIRFVNPLNGQPASGVFDAIIDSGKARVRLGNMTGRAVVIPVDSIEIISEENKLEIGQMVNLVNYPTESPAKIIGDLDNGRYEILPRSKRKMNLPINEITPI